MNIENFVSISIKKQQLYYYTPQGQMASYPVSTAKNGAGEQMGSECTPRGWHKVYALIGGGAMENSVFVGRKFTGEMYSPELLEKFPNRDWILTRIIQLEGLEEGRNRGGSVDSLQRYIYIHGTPDTTNLSEPGSHGCIRMRNSDIIALATTLSLNTYVCIE